MEKKPVSRPYFHKKGAELEAIFRHNRQDPQVLAALRDELDHRSTPKMVKLRKEVSDRIVALRSAPGGGQGDDLHPRKHVKTDTGQRRTRHKPEADHSHASDESAGDDDIGMSTGVAHIRAIGAAPGAPSKALFKAQGNVQLAIPAGASRAALFASALRAYIDELRRTEWGSQTLSLQNGHRISLDSEGPAYQFEHEGDADVFEGARITLRIVSHQVEGRVVSVFERKLVLTLKEDLGQEIPACVLHIDNTAMLEALFDRLQAIATGAITSFHSQLADATLQNDPSDAQASPYHPELESDLNEQQREALRRAAGSALLYIWGPPGTGKTRTLTRITRQFFGQKIRVLICSNTNMAVDQVLLSLCKNLGERDAALDEGRVLRIGTIALPELESDWGEYVILDRIVARKSAELQKRRIQLEEGIGRLNGVLRTHRERIRQFSELEALQTQHRVAKSRVEACAKALVGLAAEQRQLETKRVQLARELKKIENAGTLHRIILRNPREVEQEIGTVQRNLEKLQSALPRLQQDQLAAKADEELVRKGILILRARLNGIELRVEQRAVDKGEREIEPLQSELGEINRQLQAIKESVMSEAMIVGATVTKT